VNDAALVSVCEGLADVESGLGNVAIGQPADRHEVVQWIATGELGHEDGGSSLDAELVESHDRRMVEAGGGLRLAHDAIGVAGGNLLDGDLAPQAFIQRAIDRSHPARADALEDPEPP
jgi:hypothetical protein